MRSEHTPGPWEAEGPDMFGDFNILHPADSLAVGAVVSNLRPAAEVAANARLAAAAPSMKAELEWLAAFADVRSQDESKVFARVNRGALRTIAERARAVLAKAEARS